MVAVLLIIPMVDPLGWTFVGDVIGRHGVASHLLGSTAIGLYLLTAFVICCLLAFVRSAPAPLWHPERFVGTGSDTGGSVRLTAGRGRVTIRSRSLSPDWSRR